MTKEVMSINDMGKKESGCGCTNKDAINPSHYKQYPVETNEMMIRIWGKEWVRIHRILAAFEYRMRLGHKDDIEQDMKKEKWNLDMAKELK